MGIQTPQNLDEVYSLQRGDGETLPVSSVQIA